MSQLCQGSSQLLSAAGVAAIVCDIAFDGSCCWRGTRMTLVWKNVPREHHSLQLIQAQRRLVLKWEDLCS